MNFRSGVLFLLATLWSIEPCGADDSARCYSIRNPDLRAACLAQTRNSASQCYSIRDPDRRQLCLAQTTGNKSRCYGIRNADLRNACLAGMSNY